MDSKTFTSTFIPATIVTSAMWAGLFIVAVFIGDISLKVVALTWLICLTGNVLGIPLGMLASPYEKEGGHFQKIGGLIAGFFSGYLLSKSDTFISSIDFSDALTMGRILLFISFFVLGSLQTFIFRRYSDTTRELDSFKPESTTEQENSSDS
ncbi:MAG: hypothetical protein GY875_14220 [Gammaproteobacteria bacterium]|nr:hypothetical protein [Gammaproteobacteria bacterium]